MSHISISGLTKGFDGDPPTFAVDDLDLDIEEGEFLVLLGPSGCGKTTTLRCLAGLETPSGGTISLGGSVVFDGDRKINLAPDKRFIGMVFQSYALWPHMSVRKNIGYPLKARGMRAELAGGRVEQTAALVDCEPLLDRYPSQLSGGQQQRVALARGLVAGPDLVLFDEPLSNLDARLRDQVRAELHELHQRSPFTAVFVTHDQSEALSLGQRMAIMREGRIEQLDTPQRVFEHPASEYVAAFIGMSNRLEFEYRDGDWWHGGAVLAGALPLPPQSVQKVALRVRPDDLRLVEGAAEAAPYEAVLAAAVVDVEYGGRHFDVFMDVSTPAGSERIHARVSVRDALRGLGELSRGAAVAVAVDLREARYFTLSGDSMKAPAPLASLAVSR